VRDPAAPLRVVARSETLDSVLQVRLDGAFVVPPGPMLLDPPPLVALGDTPFSAPRTFVRRLEVVLPEGYTASWEPVSFDAAGPPVGLHIHETRDTSTVKFELRIDVHEGELDPAQKARFAATMRRASEAFPERMVATPPEGFDLLEFLNAVAFVSPQDAQVWLVLGQARLEAGKTEAARSALEHAIELDPSLASAVGLLAGALVRLDRVADAEARLREALTLEPHKSSVHVWLVGLLLADRRPNEAVEQAREAIVHHPDDGRLPGLLAEALSARGDAAAERDPTAAEADYREGLALTPDHPSMLNNLAWLLRDRPNALEEALGHAERSLELRPESDSAWDTLAELRFRNGEFEAALEAIAQAAALNPENAEFYERRRLKYDGARAE
jgi:tetratricopeptide (TPR) repeat protein